jgi:hypothetical protein
LPCSSGKIKYFSTVPSLYCIHGIRELWNTGMLEKSVNSASRYFLDNWFKYPMNGIIFQPIGKRIYPLFHYSIIPVFQSHDPEALDRL